MYWLHYYLQKGFKIEYLLHLGFEEKMFYVASMEIALEERQKMFSIGG